ncbi:MAG: FG-GAP-like repeat-containing protein [Ghiorsea sp.]|nr:FG-GAP-like repeat-containing protein [Ghiorsea sp.]
MNIPLIRTVALIFSIGILLISCRSTVPEPSKSLQNYSQSNKYQWVNNAPLRASNTQSVHWTDLNQDGHLDLLLGSNSNKDGFHIEWGDSTGNWTTQDGPPTTMQPLSFATSDIDRNQAIDILIGGKGDQKGLQIWSLDPKKKDWYLQSAPISSGTFSAVKFTDVNNDGWDDIVATRLDDYKNGGIVVLLNNANGGWISGTSPIAQGVFTGLSVEDINGDGHIDIITSRRGGLGSIEDNDEIWNQVGGIQIWYGDGNGRWHPTELPAIADAESVTVSDIDGNGNLDIIAGLYQKGISIWWNNNGTWRKEQLIHNGTWSDIKVGDLDADGRRELIASSSVGQGLHIWHWQGGYFQKDTTLTPNFGIYLDIALGDIHHNGTLSIAATRANAGIEIWSSQKPLPLPVQQFMGKKIGKPLRVIFTVGSAKLQASQKQTLQTQLSALFKANPSLHFEVTSFSDLKPTHTDLFPNDTSLALARAESTVHWFKDKGYTDIAIKPISHNSDMHKNIALERIKNHSKVYIQPYANEYTRLPLSTSSLSQTNLFEVTENKVFKTIDDIPEYKIGPGDELSITFWQGSKSDRKEVIVQVDGTVSLPYQAALNVSNKTPREIDTLITDILQKFERNPRIDVHLLKARSKYASIFGEVNSLSRQPTGPGTYALRGKENLIDFLSRAGGPGKESDLSNVQITRNEKTITLNLNRAIRLGDMSENAIIDDGDTVFIPSIKQSKRQVYVLGEVTKTGIVEFTGNLNFLDAISKSGGLTPDAYLPDIRVLRANREQPEILAIDFERFMEQGDLSQNIALVDKDIIIIPARPIANWNKLINDISPSMTLLLQPVSIAQQLLTLQALSGQLQ